jgi:exopolysaccharide biosynthesis polyprenyl glycosylphosphotransferase
MSVHVHEEAFTDAALASGAVTLADSLAQPAAAGERPRRSRENIMRRLLVVTDVLALSVAFIVIEIVGGFHGGETSSVVRDLALLAFGIPVWIFLAQGHNLYHHDSRRADHRWTEEVAPIIQMATLWSWTILLGISATGIRHVTIPKLALFWALTIVLLLFLRSGTRAWSRRRGWYRHSALVVGPALQTAAVVRRVRRHPEYAIDVVACVDSTNGRRLDETTERMVGQLIGDVPMLRGDAELSELIDHLEIDRVIFTSEAPETRNGSATLCDLADRDIQIDLVPSWSDVVGRRLDYHELEGMPLLTLPRTVIRRSDQMRKRAFDVFASAAALIVLSPVFAVCAVLIKLDSRGPVLFRQRRVGRDDELFRVLKFRSMYVDADVRKEAVADLNFHGGGNDNGMFKIREDPRITRVGRWLRRTSLDELPQLINVLKGDMSLVGPRPLIENEDRQVEGRFRRRLDSLPGLTGPWQIHGRSEIPFEEMINLDYLYVTNWSFWGDVKLMLRTVQAIVRGHGAY